ncbi:hypothetical protein BDW42DRAFT_81883 [Aspergillus taichungensis]|uniref:Uncharacterized protein n=1 Tax=Aspergillus taichungensis TaxID=482145 RepID=A0A2J5HXY7_9EURO|nr:hypothetical protein BDW42DRAFT_81883 [Aspergillus taichungensis]
MRSLNAGKPFRSVSSSIDIIKMDGHVQGREDDLGNTRLPQSEQRQWHKSIKVSSLDRHHEPQSAQRELGPVETSLNSRFPALEAYLLHRSTFFFSFFLSFILANPYLIDGFFRPHLLSSCHHSSFNAVMRTSAPPRIRQGRDFFPSTFSAVQIMDEGCPTVRQSVQAPNFSHISESH